MNDVIVNVLFHIRGWQRESRLLKSQSILWLLMIANNSDVITIKVYM